MELLAALLAAALGVAALALWHVRKARDEALDAAAAANKEMATLEALHAEVEGRLERALAAIEGARIGILVTDPRRKVVQTNAAAEHFVGARYGAALAETKLRAVMEQARTSDSMAAEEIQIRNPVPRSLMVTAAPVGASGWMVAYIDDVTERRKVDAARRDFVANVSHELKTPLGALALLAETLETAQDPDVRRRLITRIGEQAGRMTRLVDDIMDLSLVEAAANERALVDIYKVVGAAAAHVRDIAVASGVDISVEAPPGSLLVMGDERQLVSAVSNLMSNAVAYTAVAAPPNTVTVSVSEDDDDVIISVADTGIGIPASHRARIFERFYRIDPARSRETGGTGLGLAIVRHVALNHGGRVEVESVSGVGSTFRIVIPIVEEIE